MTQLDVSREETRPIRESVHTTQTVWAWQDEDGFWRTYDNEVMHLLRQVRELGESQVEAEVNGEKMMLDLFLMEVISQETKKKHAIREVCRHGRVLLPQGGAQSMDAVHPLPAPNARGKDSGE